MAIVKNKDGQDRVPIDAHLIPPLRRGWESPSAPVGPVNTVAPLIALSPGYAGDFIGSVYTRTPGSWTYGVATAIWQYNGADIAGQTGPTYTRTAAQELGTISVKETNGTVIANSNGMTRAALTALVTNTTAYPMPVVARPGYLIPFRDPVFDTIVTRVTDTHGNQIQGQPTPRNWALYKRPVYSRHQAWNADESLLWIEGNQDYHLSSGPGDPSRVPFYSPTPNAWSGQIYLDGQNYVPKITNTRPAGWVEGRWHDTNPALQIFTTDTAICSYNVITQQVIVLRDFTAQNYYNLTFGHFGGEQSQDGDIWGIACKKQIGGSRAPLTDPYWMFAYKISTNGLLCQVDVTTPGWVTNDNTSGGAWDFECYVSPLGTYLTGYYQGASSTATTPGTFSELSNTYTIATGVKLRDRFTTADYQRPSHGGYVVIGGVEYNWGRNYSGTQSYPNNGRPSLTNIATDVTQRHSDHPGWPDGFVYHSSASNHDGPFASLWGSGDFWQDSDGSHVWENLAAIMAYDGSVNGRLCHIHKTLVTALWTAANHEEDYFFEPQFSLSRTGKRGVFHTDWDGSGPDIDTFVVDFRHKSLPGKG